MDTTSTSPRPTSDHKPRKIGSSNRDELALPTLGPQLANGTLENQRSESIPAPIHLLIDDVLLEIFIHLIHTARPLSTSSARQHPAVTLSRVCRRWRLLAFSSPHLWTEFTIDLEHDRLCDYIGQPPDLFLSLSRSLSLDICIDGDDDRVELQNLARYRIVADALISSVARWKTARVFIHWPADNPELWRLVQCDPALYSQLETLDFLGSPSSWQYGTAGHPQRMDALAILHAPALRNLVLFLWSYKWEIPSSWAELRELTVTDMTENAAVVGFLSACPNLSTLTVTISEIERIEAPPSPVPDHVQANLKSLFLSYKSDYPISLLHIPSTPSLQTLSVVREAGGYRDLETEDVPRCHASILRIVQSCSTSLVKLTLHYCFFHDAELVRILRPLNTLEHLDLKGKDYALTYDLFLRLTPPPSHMMDMALNSERLVLFPNLVSLKIEVTHDDVLGVEKRIEVAFFLAIGLISQGISSLHILSDAWSTVAARNKKWRSLIPAAALEEALVRQSKKEEVERRVREIRYTLGFQGLRLERTEIQEWRRDDLYEGRGPRHYAHLVGYAVVYKRS